MVTTQASLKSARKNTTSENTYSPFLCNLLKNTFPPTDDYQTADVTICKPELLIQPAMLIPLASADPTR